MKISLILPTLNSEKFVGYAIKSIIDQIDEVIIIDMLSTDNTIPIVDYIGSSKIKFALLKNLLEKGEYHDLDSSFKYGLKLATGDIIIRSDDDWIWGESVRDLRKCCEQGIKEKKRGAFYSIYNLITPSEYFLPIQTRSHIMFRYEAADQPLISFGSYKTDNNVICHFNEIKRSSGRQFVKQKYSRYLRTSLSLGHWKFLKDSKEEFIRKWIMFTQCSRKVAEDLWLGYHKKERASCSKDLLQPLYAFRHDFIKFGGFDIEKSL